MNEALSSRRDALRRGGFTLVEVVIALAIFVFGAVAIIRIFPPALGIIQNSGDKLTATNLNNTTLARLTKEGGSVPKAIHDVYTTSDTPFAGAVVGTALRNNSLPKRNVQVVGGSNSAIDHFKLVSGEKHIVRSTVVLQNGITATPVLYVVTNFPIAGVIPTGQPKLYPAARLYKETPVTGVVATTRAVGGARQSGFLDFTDATPAISTLPASDANFYYASYQYLDNGVLNATTDEVLRSTTPDVPLPFNIDDATNIKARLLQGRRFAASPLTGALNTSRVLDGPVTLSFRQQLADLSKPGTVGTENITDDKIIQNTLNNVGLLVVTRVPGIAAGMEVSVDYQINNWQQIVHNGSPSVLPEATPVSGAATTPATPTTRTARELVLPIRALNDAEDGTDESKSAAEVYSLLSYIDPQVSATTPTLQANGLDISNNQATLTRQGPLNPTDPASDLSTNNPFFLWNANRKGGRVLFDINDHSTILGNPAADFNVVDARVVYQTLDNWTHQVSVAPDSYTPFYGFALNNRNTNGEFLGDSGNINVAQPWRYYSWISSSAQPGRIFFPPSEAGKTISLSYSYRIGGVEKVVSDGVVTINSGWIERADAPVEAQPLAISDNDPITPKIWLAYAEPQTTGSSALPITSIRSIKGLSIQARTAWLDGSNYTQVSTTGFRGGSN